MTSGRIAALIVGILLATVGLALAAGGAGALWLTSANRDADGYLTSPSYELATDGYALVTDAVDLQAGPDEWVPWAARIDTRLTVTSTAEQAVFVGIARTADIEAYLDGVAYARLTDLGDNGDDVELSDVAGSATPADPAAQDIWVTQVQGPGTQTLPWQPSSGRWSALMMNADASPGMAVTAAGSVETGILWPIGIGLLVAGLVLCLLGGVLIIVATAGKAANAHRPMGQTALPTPAGDGVYPVSVEGYLDEPLSRGLWLVKWLLAIPHFVVLAFLWTAFVILTVAAGVAILFTGRYPRGIFDFNVGVMRWSWRVAYYCTSVLATDTYPPFSLAATDYPATLDVAYPEQLSRGLVLVKWWLLAIPHYLILTVLVGGSATWAMGDRAGDNWQTASSGGLIGILAFIAGVVLLATARYPRGLFDLTMGLNRWVYRVIAYAALMTDQYPPFRLDSGGGEPVDLPPAPQPSAGDRAVQEEMTSK